MTQNSFRALAALSFSLVLGLAQGQEVDTYAADPPDRAARLSYLLGDVSMQPADEQEWVDAMINRPLTTGDKLWTDDNSRAEIYVGETAVRLGSYTGFSFLNVDDDTIQMRMTAGVIEVNVRALDGNDQIEVDTPNIALSILRPGRYRVEVDDTGDTTVVKITEGEAEASSGSQSTVVHSQQTATFRGNGELVAQSASLGAPDEFDSWSLERDQRDRRAATSQTARYVSPDVTGYQDLDDYGTWASEPEYGYVWTPRRVVVGWSPYQYGRWVWVRPWGWTWIDDAPWGYAPSHYGRWAHVRDRWCWVPGPRHLRAVYAPALVGWVGHGGGVAWFPLGPREVYVPGRRFSHRYYERVNVHNTVNVNRTIIRNVFENGNTHMTYRNRAIPGAVTAVTQTTFTTGQRVSNHRVRIDEREINRTQATAAVPRISPVRESRLGGPTTRVNVRMPPRTVEERQVIVKRAPPQAATRFVRNPDANNAQREMPSRSERPQENPIDRGRVSDEFNARQTRESRPARNDRPPQAQPNTRIETQNGVQPNIEPRAVRMPQREREQPQAAVAPPVDRPREDRPQRTYREREPQNQEPQERRQVELPQQQRSEVRQQMERRIETQRTESRPREIERPRAERQEAPQRQQAPESRQQQPERQQAPEPKQSPEPRQQPEIKQERFRTNRN